MPFGVEGFRLVLDGLRKPSCRTAACCRVPPEEGRGRLPVRGLIGIGRRRARPTGARSRRAAGGGSAAPCDTYARAALRALRRNGRATRGGAYRRLVAPKDGAASPSLPAIDRSVGEAPPVRPLPD